MKTCRNCGKEKPLIDFYKNKDAPDGYRATCKQCEAEKYSTNPTNPTITNQRPLIDLSRRGSIMIDDDLSPIPPSPLSPSLEFSCTNIRSGWGDCNLCGKRDVLWECYVGGSIRLDACNDCIMNTETFAEITFHRLGNGKIVVVRVLPIK